MSYFADLRDPQDVKDGLELYAEGLVRRHETPLEIHRWDPQYEGPNPRTRIKLVEACVLFYNTSRSPEVHLVLRDGTPFCLSRLAQFDALMTTARHLLAELKPDGHVYSVTAYDGLVLGNTEGMPNGPQKA